MSKMRSPAILICTISMILLNSTPVQPEFLTAVATWGIDKVFSKLLDSILSDDKSDRMLERLESIFSQVEEFPRFMVGLFKEAMESITSRMKYSSLLAQLEEHVGTIKRANDEWQASTKFHHETRISIAESLTIREDRLSKTLDQLRRLVKPSTAVHGALFQSVIVGYETEEKAAKICGRNISLHQEVYNLFNIISRIMLKGVRLQISAYRFRRGSDKRKFVPEIEYARDLHRTAMSQIKAAATTALRDASRDLRTCDPAQPVRGDTYIELTWLFNALIANPLYLNNDVGCWSCSRFKEVYVTHTSKHPHAYCHGPYFNCFDEDLQISYYCPPTKRYRLYDGIRGLKRMTASNFGNMSCGSPLVFASVTGSQSHSLVVPSSCHSCMCYCDGYSYVGSIRIFDMRMVRSNTEENMIITGVKWVNYDNIISLQIQEGALGPRGKVNESTVAWKDIDRLDLKKANSNRDYLRIRYQENYVYLHSFTAEPGRVLTGIGHIRFRQGFALSIEATEFDYASGKVSHGDLMLYDPADWYYRNSWYEIEMDAPHIPTRAWKENIVSMNQTYQCVRFRQTDMRKDVAQTAVPFLDSQPVETIPPAPLSGAGMYYRGQPGYGGYLGLKLISYDYSEYIEETEVYDLIPDKD